MKRKYAVAGGVILAVAATVTPSQAAGLSSAQTSQLVVLANEEKMAHDLYVTLADATGLRQFSNIAASETQHLAAVRSLMSQYGVNDPTANLAVGEFSLSEVRDLYAKLVKQSVSATAARSAGVKVERLDIAQLRDMLKQFSQTDVRASLAQLKRASFRHLRAFGG